MPLDTPELIALAEITAQTCGCQECLFCQIIVFLTEELKDDEQPTGMDLS
jgi:hypothetical protein